MRWRALPVAAEGTVSLFGSEHRQRRRLPLLIFRSGCVCFLPLGHRDLAFDGKCHTIRTWYSKRGGIAADLSEKTSSQPQPRTKSRDIAGTYSYIPFAHDMSAGSSIMLALCSFRRVCFIV